MDVLNFKPANPLTSSNKQPWSAVWTPGVNLVNFYNLYDSKGDVTISTATAIPTTLDGPIQVVRYGALTVNAALTASQRCRGLIILSDSLTVGAAGSISMTARGAAGSSKWAADKDIFVPQSITFTGKNTSYSDFLKWIRQTGYCIFDPSMYACPPSGMGDVTCDWATWTPYGSTIISASGCGAGAASLIVSDTNAVGANGGAAVKGCGGGGQGGVWGSYGKGAVAKTPGGRVWGGAPGGAGQYNYSSTLVSSEPDAYGGRGGTPTGNYPSGGGAGNPAGTGSGGGSSGTDGTGGVLFSICRGNVTLTSGHSFSSSGSPGGAAECGGGASGGGFVGEYHAGTLTGTPNMSASGGVGGTGTVPGGNGGNGTTQSATFATMGWAA